MAVSSTSLTVEDCGGNRPGDVPQPSHTRVLQEIKATSTEAGDGLALVDVELRPLAV